MTKACHRHHRRLRHLRSDGLDRTLAQERSKPPGASRPTSCGSATRRPALRVPAAPRPRPPALAPDINYRANIDALKRAGVHRRGVAVGLRHLQGGTAARHFVVVDQFIDRSFARESFFGEGCVAHVLDGASGLAAAAHRIWPRRPGRGLPVGARRHLSGDGGPAVLHHGRKRPTAAGATRDRHDQHAGSQARPRGGALLRHRRHGDRFRLLASRPRRRHRAGHRQGADGNAEKARAWWRGGAAISRASTSRARSAPTARSTMP